jgi:hypothetical protein
MAKAKVLAYLAFGLVMAFPSQVSSQSTCRGADSLGGKFRGQIARYSAPVRPDERVVRDSLRLGAAAASTVVLVSDEAVCRKANTAYQNAVAGPGGSPFSGRVYVVKSGTTYAVLDPDFHVDNRTDNWIIVIMDSKYKKLSLF